MERIEILLATYNGVRMLKEQLDSILAQSYSNFTILARDDGSTDGTVTILEEYACKYPGKVSLIPFSRRLGVKGNFSALMSHSKCPYVMLCDQDDVWFPNKVTQTYMKMKSMESEHGTMTPLLVHTDLQVVDRGLQVIDSSFWKYAQLNPNRFSGLNRLIVQNVVTGCTMMLNRSLLELAFPIPIEAMMHDWWIALVATAFGGIGCVDNATIHYRQHSTNVLGAKKLKNWNRVKERLKKLWIIDQQRYDQASQFLKRYQNWLTPDQKALLQAYVSQPNRNWMARRYMTLKYRFFKNGFLRNVAEFLLG